jgi:hypothetical protein
VRARLEHPSEDKTLPKQVGAAEAQRLLGIARTTLHELANSGRLPGRLIDKPGTPRRWQFKTTDVLRLKARGNFLRHKQRSRKQLELWRSYFGAIPEGFTAAFRDGDRSNIAPENLCLLPLRSQWRPSRMTGHARTRPQSLRWTPLMTKALRERFSSTLSAALAQEIGVSVSSVRRRARQLRLRKNRELISGLSRTARGLPIGSERLHDSTGSIWVKVTESGDRHCERWRPKQHLVWEQATGRTVPAGHCVLFRDGNKHNFSPENLELVTRREMSARGFARFLSYPESLQRAIKETAKLRREVRRNEIGTEPAARVPRPGRKPGTRLIVWTQAMDDRIRRDYPSRPVPELLAALRVSEPALRNRAKRLHVRRLPETIVAEARAAAAMKADMGAVR